MTQRKEKTGICKSVVIATVVAIRDVVKNGFHCIMYDAIHPVSFSLGKDYSGAKFFYTEPISLNKAHSTK